MLHKLRLTLLCAASCLAAYAQATGGSGAVTGIVRDSYGEQLPDATVVLTNTSTGIHRSVDTNIDGVFYMPAVPPASGYIVTVNKSGFVDWKSKELKLGAGETLNLRIQIQQPDTTPDEKQTTLPAVESVTSDIEQKLDRSQIDTVLNSRLRVGELALLAPTASVSPTGTLVYRAVPFYNAFLIDGQDVTNRFFMNSQGLGQRVPVEALQDVQVSVTGGPIDSVPVTGAAINTASRIGSNAFHGSAYGFDRPNSMQALDRYANGVDVRGSRNLVGGSLGGPVIPNAVGFFINIEKEHSDSPGLNRITNPFLAATSANCKSPATTAQCAAAASYIQSRQNVIVPRTDKVLSGLFGIDGRVGSQNAFALRVDAMHREAPYGMRAETVSGDGSLLSNNANLGQESRDARGSWTFTRNSFANQLRGSFFQDRISTLPFSPLSNTNISTGKVAITVAGTDIGASRANLGLNEERRESLEDNLTLAKSSHVLTLSLGGSLNRDTIYGVRNSNGTYDYATLTSFARDLSPTTTTSKNYVSYNQRFGIPGRKEDTYGAHAYIGDTWKAGARITVTGGVRWDEYMTPQPADYNTTYSLTRRIARSKTNFGPRLGVAIAASDRTIFRFGFGMFYSPFSGEVIDALYLGNGITQASISANSNQTGNTVFPNVWANPPAANTGLSNLVYGNNKLREPLAEQFNFGFEHQIGKQGTLSLYGMHVSGKKLWAAQDINLGSYYKTGKTYAIYEPDGTNVSFTTPIWNTKADTNYQHIYEVNNGASSKYNAFVAQIKKPIRKDLAFSMSYTWSHSTDDAGGYMPYFPNVYTYPGSTATDKGSSSTDQRHRMTANWVWSPKFTSGNSVAERFIVNGWEVSGLATLASALPKTGTVLIDGQQFSGVTMFYLNSYNGSGGWSRSPMDRINSLLTGREYNVDMRFTRTLPFTERIRGAISIESFNILNAQWNTNVNTIAYTAVNGTMNFVPSAGTGTSTASYPDGTNARRVQFTFRLTF